MRIEQIAIPAVRLLAKRPRLAHALFRLTHDESPFDPDYYVDPYRSLEAVRQKYGQVYYHKVFRRWFVVGYDEALELLRSPELSVSSAVNVLMDVRPYSQLSDAGPTPTSSDSTAPTLSRCRSVMVFTTAWALHSPASSSGSQSPHSWKRSATTSSIRQRQNGSDRYRSVARRYCRSHEPRNAAPSEFRRRPSSTAWHERPIRRYVTQ